MFTYDKPQRLRTSTVTLNGANPYVQQVDYTGNGNIGSKTGVGSYVYGTRPSACNAVSGAVTPGPHAVSGTGDGRSWCYRKLPR